MCDKIFRMHNGDCLTMCTLCANKFLYGTLTHVKSILDDGTYHWAYVNARLRATIFFYFISISFPFFFCGPIMTHTAGKYALFLALSFSPLLYFYSIFLAPCTCCNPFNFADLLTSIDPIK